MQTAYIKKIHSTERTNLERARACHAAAMAKKAEDVIILDVRDISSITDYFVIMSGRSTRHVQALADAIEHELRNKRLKAGNTEGLGEGLWVVLDYDDVVIHIFYHELRPFYNLEGLWHDAPRVKIT